MTIHTDMITSADEFARLRQSDDGSEQFRASHASAPEAVWIDVTRRYPELRKWVAHNKTVPLAILRLLAKDEDRNVRWTVATKRKLDRDLFEMLADDSDESVRRAVANNAKCPQELKNRISTTRPKEPNHE
jgi:hypothetical protein